MLQRLIDDLKGATGSALRLASLAAAAMVALFLTISFLCAALFVFVFERYGVVEACLAGAAVFFVVALTAAGCYLARSKTIETDLAKEKSAVQSALADPALLAVGLQIARTIGIKRVIPILALGGVALGLLVARAGAGDDASAE